MRSPLREFAGWLTSTINAQPVSMALCAQRLPKLIGMASPHTPSNIFKLNCDTTLNEEGWIGLGVVGRDHKGEVRFATNRRIRGYWSPEIAEGKTILLAVNLALRYNLKVIGYGK